jgi:hypothetical protein
MTHLTAKSLLVLASTVILGSKSHGSYGHILLLTTLGAFQTLSLNPFVMTIMRNG